MVPASGSSGSSNNQPINIHIVVNDQKKAASKSKAKAKPKPKKKPCPKQKVCEKDLCDKKLDMTGRWKYPNGQYAKPPDSVPTDKITKIATSMLKVDVMKATLKIKNLTANETECVEKGRMSKHHMVHLIYERDKQLFNSLIKNKK